MLTTYPPLPSMSDEDLAASFGTDQDGIRRYRILEAVLLRGVSQRDAAEANGVSERTVRNVLQLFRRTGRLEHLRGRSSAPHKTIRRRANVYEPALAAALDEDPNAGGDRLWQRARELLGLDGHALSRRTAYRILAHLRAERERDADQSEEIGGVRAALALLQEDPPLSLGATPLAQKLLSDESDPLLRGTLLKQALRTGIDRLRPNSEISAIDREWWPYLICSGEYEAGQSRAELEDNLALSPSTYSRAKRQALAQVTAALPLLVATLAESRQARLVQRLPRAADFVGRREQQSFYAWRLQTEGMAHLWGLPGSGKTALAAEVAAEGRRYGQSIVWHACDSAANARLASMLRGLVEGLATRESTSERITCDADLLDILREALLHRPTVVIIDDVHRADTVECAPLFELLQGLVARGAARVLLVGQHPPEDTSWPALPGLSEHEAWQLWADLPPLPDTQWQALYTASGGMPGPLRRVAAAYRRAGERARSDDWRAIVGDWAATAIWQTLTEQEQMLLAVSQGLVALPWASHREYVLDTLALDHNVLDLLLRRELLDVTGQLFRVHPALTSLAETTLREDSRLLALRDEVLSLLPLEDEALPTFVPPPAAQAIVVQSAPGEVPAGLALIERLREALERSAAYLEQGGDHTARSLAAELAVLQAALPGSAWARS